MRVFAVLIALSVSGCAVRETTLPTPCSPGSREGVCMFQLTEGASPACARLESKVDRSRIAVGGNATLHVVVHNVCAGPFQVQGTSGSCHLHGIDASVLIDGSRWGLLRGIAYEARPCTADMPPVEEVAPGGTMEANFTWQGLLAERCSASCSPRPANGTYTIEAYLVQTVEGPVTTLANITVTSDLG